jgi:hypothetical protein
LHPRHPAGGFTDELAGAWRTFVPRTGKCGDRKIRGQAGRSLRGKHEGVPRPAEVSIEQPREHFVRAGYASSEDDEGNDGEYDLLADHDGHVLAHFRTSPRPLLLDILTISVFKTRLPTPCLTFGFGVTQVLVWPYFVLCLFSCHATLLHVLLYDPLPHRFFIGLVSYL